MVVTVNKARHAWLPLSWISHKSTLTQTTLAALGMIHALETISKAQLIGTVAVSITFAFLFTLIPHISKVTLTSVWSNTCSIHTLLVAVGFTFSADSIFQVSYFTGTVITGFCVGAVLALIITVMVSIHTLVLWGTGSVRPDGGTLGLFGPQVNWSVSFALFDVILQTGSDPCGIISASLHTYSLANIPSKGTPATPWSLDTLGTYLVL